MSSSNPLHLSFRYWRVCKQWGVWGRASVCEHHRLLQVRLPARISGLRPGEAVQRWVHCHYLGLLPLVSGSMTENLWTVCVCRQISTSVWKEISVSHEGSVWTRPDPICVCALRDSRSATTVQPASVSQCVFSQLFPSNSGFLFFFFFLIIINFISIVFSHTKLQSTSQNPPKIN